MTLYFASCLPSKGDATNGPKEQVPRWPLAFAVTAAAQAAADMRGLRAATLAPTMPADNTPSTSAAAAP